MKKTVIALSLAGLFSAGAMANSINIDIDNSVPGVSDRPTPDYSVPDRNGPTVDRPSPDANLPDRNGPTVDRPMPDNTPDRDGPVVDRPTPTTPEQPIVVDPDFGVTPTSDRELITDLQQQMNERFAEMDEQMDGVRAGMHAITNARPFVTEGEFAIGAGVGFSGSKEALAIGGAYGFNEKISVSGTFHYETSGKVSGSEVAGGVGIQYKF
ncbi:hypothetical protein G5S52_14720 [Grimontia sp. S25]|uniref:Trimeric autotransporter adhesin YadA-like C-terminal membrane anchor domain-containing protein n=1 Tax=Grimontia sedimenti TaxID=2711294 RepID=A0A6M1RH70_9GAMM|nr:YadA C-terminal domain-containing protein [Grimontia sedimenti]NGN98852.1 hypothetical protein [Grimontia sedimenti]